MDDENEGRYTFCLYINNILNEDIETAGGHFYMKTNDNKKIICVEPLCNRAIFFPSNNYHKGNAFNRYVNDMRISIAWKIEVIS
jgi:hypothetical protein